MSIDTREEFIDRYCAASGVEWSALADYMVALPCACGDAICSGWAMVSKNEWCITNHQRMYGMEAAS